MTAPVPQTFDDLYPGRFLKSGQLHGKHVTLTIKSVYRDELESEGKVAMKAVVSFTETEFELLINKTNGTLLKAMFGPQLADWVGKPITIGPDKDTFGRETVDCIRVFGSPVLQSELRVEIRLPKKKPKTRVLTPTKRAEKPTETREREPGEEG